MKVKLTVPDSADVEACSEGMGSIALSSDTTFTGIPDDIPAPSCTVGTRKVVVAAPAAGAGTGTRAATAAETVSDKAGLAWLNRLSNNLYWKVTLAPQETVSIPFEYTVEVPKGDVYHVHD